MNKSRPVATETVKSLDYTKNILQTIPNNDTMEVVTQTNAVKSPIPCPAGRRKHPHPERQFRCVAPGSLKKEITYGIYYETRQLLWRPLYLPR